MASKILIDTNILLDYLLMRSPYCEDAERIILLCKEGKLKGCIAAHSIPNMFYILRKEYNPKVRREILHDICTLFDVEGIDKYKILNALENESFSDFEDCLQTECAMTYGARYIVTRNVGDYSSSAVAAISPEDLLKELKL